MRSVRTALVVALLLGPAVLSSRAAEVRVTGRVVDQTGLPLPGATVTVVVAGGSSALASLTTDGDGAFGVDVPPGAYRLDARLDGFEPTARVIDVSGPIALPDLVMTLAGFSAETTVVASSSTATEVQPRQFGAPAVIAQHVIDNAPLRTSRYDDLLPMLPNVVRGPDGLISVAGARAPSGAVLVNSLSSSDVASGTPVAVVPLGAVETVQVIPTGFAAEFGPATGGITIINTRAGSDVFRFSVNSFTPRLRLADGGVKGIEAWSPNTSLRGPIVKGRAWFAQSFDFHFDKTRAETVAGRQDRREHGLTSFTQADITTSRGHTLTAWMNVLDDHVEGERLGAFTPLGTVPVVDRTRWSTAAIDRVAFANSTFETRMHVRHQAVSLSPVGTGPYSIGHDITRGAYFDATDRRTISFDVGSVFSRALSSRLGRHLFKAGASAGRHSMDGFEQAAPVIYRRLDGTVARSIEFVGDGVVDAVSTRVGAFVQDSWELDDRITLDLGVRLDVDGATSAVVTPRAGLTWSPDPRTTVTAGLGWFAGEVPLAALAFEDYQARRLSMFDASGWLTSPAIVYDHVRSDDLKRPIARISSARLDRRLGTSWLVRAGVHEQQGSREVIVRPATSGSRSIAWLSTTGESRVRSLETTLGYHPAQSSHQFYVSYVRAASTGSTGDFGQIEALFREPRLEADESAPLPASVPHRLLAWGIFSLPARVTVAPFFELRSGFPYSAIRDDWSYAEPRYARRYPAFASLDVVITKVVPLPRDLRARVGIKLYNLAGRHNGRDIQSCIDCQDFGRTYNPLGRQVRGVFEIIWSGTKP